MRKMFSENQIKSIVNQGIESGEISGGTKLYRHRIRDGAESYAYTLYFVSTSKSNYSGDYSGGAELYEAISYDMVSLIRDENNFIYDLDYDSEYLCRVWINGTLQTQNLDDFDYSNVVDEVTPL